MKPTHHNNIQASIFTTWWQILHRQQASLTLSSQMSYKSFFVSFTRLISLYNTFHKLPCSLPVMLPGVFLQKKDKMSGSSDWAQLFLNWPLWEHYNSKGQIRGQWNHKNESYFFQAYYLLYFYWIVKSFLKSDSPLLKSSKVTKTGQKLHPEGFT